MLQIGQYVLVFIFGGILSLVWVHIKIDNDRELDAKIEAKLKKWVKEELNDLIDLRIELMKD
jgi:hypothetical protein